MVGMKFGLKGSNSGSENRVSRAMAVLDFIFRVVSIAATLGSAIAMATTRKSLPFFTRFTRFRAKYNDFDAFIFFAVANGIVCAYLILSLVLSVIHIIRSTARNTRIILIFFDSIMLVLVTAAAAAATAIVYLAHKGNTAVNWLSICQQFTSFCTRISGTLIGSFATVVIFMLLILMSAAALSRH